MIANKKAQEVLVFKMSIVGPKIKKLRKKYNLSQTHLAALIDSSQSYIARLEKNTDHNPRLLTLIKIATVFNLTVEELLKNTMS
jgi:XRE family transcriptional regulator of biofilm formation